VAIQVSKTQIDRLGDRLKKGYITEADLRLLDEYRRSFSEAYEFVVGAVRNELGLEPTGRPAKSTTSISEKLVRESIRLTQVQDIAGCRLVVPEIADQERVVAALVEFFPDAILVDRRSKPSHGYRAIHLIVRVSDKLVEIQVRTMLQHLWAEQSEKMSDLVDPAIKYGGGAQDFQELLRVSSDAVGGIESLELKLVRGHTQLLSMSARTDLGEKDFETMATIQKDISDIQNGIISVREKVYGLLQEAIDHFSRLRRDDDVIPD